MNDTGTSMEKSTRSGDRSRWADPRFLRRWHRWIGVPAALFLLFASTTGILVAFTEFFGEEEALREATRDLVSPMTLESPRAEWVEPILAAVAAAKEQAGDAPLDRIVVQFKGPQPTVDLFLGRPEGGEDKRLVMDAKTGKLLRVESYVDKPFLYRLHSGEFFGDGGLVAAMFWGLALALMSVSGFLTYRKMLKPNAKGLKRYFW